VTDSVRTLRQRPRRVCSVLSMSAWRWSATLQFVCGVGDDNWGGCPFDLRQATMGKTEKVCCASVFGVSQHIKKS